MAFLCLLLFSGAFSRAWARPSASSSSAATLTDGSVLPFPPVSSASIARAF
jgi:hypothetical protein